MGCGVGDPIIFRVAHSALIDRFVRFPSEERYEIFWFDSTVVVALLSNSSEANPSTPP